MFKCFYLCVYKDIRI